MDERSEKIAMRFERPLIVAAVLTILQLIPPPDPWRTVANVFNSMIWLSFLVEAVVMLTVVPSKKAWVRKHTIDVAIVLSTCPILAAVIQSARVLRLARLLRFMRLTPLVRVLFSAEGVRYAAPITEGASRRSLACGTRSGTRMRLGWVRPRNAPDTAWGPNGAQMGKYGERQHLLLLAVELPTPDTLRQTPVGV